MLPDRNELAFIGTLHIYQEEVLAQGCKTVEDHITHQGMFVNSSSGTRPGP